MAKSNTWQPRIVIDAALKESEVRMRQATQVVVGNVKRLINRGNPTGKNPSKPGEPPKKVTARLFNSITDEVIRTEDQVIGAVGTNVEYGRRLELGFTGTDSAGRIVDQEPRPYLRPGLSMSQGKVAKILGAKK